MDLKRWRCVMLDQIKIAIALKLLDNIKDKSLYRQVYDAILAHGKIRGYLLDIPRGFAVSKELEDITENAMKYMNEKNGWDIND